MKVIDNAMHERKWFLTIQGLKGPAGERETVTRQKCIDFAKTHLLVTDTKVTHVTACQRLSQQENASIIIKFLDLDQRNAWLAGAGKYLKNAALPGNQKVSISPDMPPFTRQLKNDVLDH